MPFFLQFSCVLGWPAKKNCGTYFQRNPLGGSAQEDMSLHWGLSLNSRSPAFGCLRNVGWENPSNVFFPQLKDLLVFHILRQHRWPIRRPIFPTIFKAPSQRTLKKHAAEAEDLPHYEVKSKTLKISSRSISKQAVVIPSFLACFGYRIRMN